MINESKVAYIKHASRVLAATVIAFVIITSVFATTAFAGMVNDYNVVINDNGNEQTITTDEKEPIEILNDAHITLGENDRLDISSFEEGKGGTITIDRLNKFNIKASNGVNAYDVYADTVGEALSELGIDVTDCTLNFDASSPVIDGMVVEINFPVHLTVNADGEAKAIGTLQGHTVADALVLAGVKLGENDYAQPSVDTAVEDGMTINVLRVETEKITVSEKIKFKTVQKEDSSMNRGEKAVETEGANGQRTVTYKVTYVNGKESKKEELSSTVITDAVNRVEIVGTKKASASSNGVQSKGGYQVGQIITGKYTHYCACAKCNGNSRGITTSGKKIYNGMSNPYYIACNWLPLGSVVEVDGVEYTVADRGGSGLSKKGRIDIFTPEGHSECMRRGTGKCTITIVRLGW